MSPLGTNYYSHQVPVGGEGLLQYYRALEVGGGGEERESAGIRKAVRHARMAHKATKWPIIKILTGPVMRPDRTKLVKYKLFCEKDFNL